MSEGFYDLLGVDADATSSQLRAAYATGRSKLARRRRALIEQGGDPRQIAAARSRLDAGWAVLSDPARRRRYDALLAWTARDDRPRTEEALWPEVRDAMIDPAGAIGLRLLRSMTELRELGAVEAPPSVGDAGKPTIVPTDDERTTTASVVTLPTAATEAPASTLRVVDGSPDSSAVIVLPSERQRRSPVSSEDIARLIDVHGYTGPLLHAVREARGLSLEELADKTRIAPRYLMALESDDTAALPPSTFVRGYLREVSRVLRLDPAKVVQGYTERPPG
jgi:hypothetical protein